MSAAPRFPSLDALVVDDEPMIRELVARVLEDECHGVVVASSGDEAIERMQGRSFGLVVTDLRMPGRDGFAVLAAARSLLPEARLIVVSGYVEREDELRIRSLGAGLVRKPFGPRELLAALVGG